jgi:hypothetical protein
LLNKNVLAQIVLQCNVTYKEYQIYNKFGSDISLGFKNSEHATMFKLVFGDKELENNEH